MRTARASSSATSTRCSADSPTSGCTRSRLPRSRPTRRRPERCYLKRHGATPPPPPRDCAPAAPPTADEPAADDAARRGACRAPPLRDKLRRWPMPPAASSRSFGVCLWRLDDGERLRGAASSAARTRGAARVEYIRSGSPGNAKPLRESATRRRDGGGGVIVASLGIPTRRRRSRRSPPRASEQLRVRGAFAQALDGLLAVMRGFAARACAAIFVTATTQHFATCDGTFTPAAAAGEARVQALARARADEVDGATARENARPTRRRTAARRSRALPLANGSATRGARRCRPSSCASGTRPTSSSCRSTRSRVVVGRAPGRRCRGAFRGESRTHFCYGPFLRAALWVARVWARGSARIREATAARLGEGVTGAGDARPLF